MLLSMLPARRPGRDKHAAVTGQPDSLASNADTRSMHISFRQRARAPAVYGFLLSLDRAFHEGR